MNAPFALRSGAAYTVRPWLRWAASVVLDGSDDAAPLGDVPVRLVERWRISGLVYAALTRQRIHPQAAAKLQAKARQTVGVNLTRSANVRDALSPLDAAGIPYAVYKGAALTEQLPALRAIRATSDVDLLVQRRDFHAARVALRSAGFHEERATEPVSIFWNNERVFARHQPITFYLDLHRGLHRRPLFERLAAAAVRQRVVVQGVGYAPLSLAPLLIAAHRAKSGYSADAREMLDLYVLWRHASAVDFERWVDQAVTFGMAGALYAVWTLYNWWWEADVAPAAYERLARGLGWRRPWVEWMAAYDGPGDADSPWAKAPFLRMYLPMVVLTDHVVTPWRLAAIHAALRSLDVVVRGPHALATPPEWLLRR